MTNVALVLTTVAALGCAVAAGVLFSFSAFVMRALAGLPAPQGIAAMQSINLAAVRPWLTGELFGTAAVYIGASLAALSTHTPGRFVVLAGTVSYLVGVIGVTGSYHQPRNVRLAHVDPAARSQPRRRA